MDEPVVTDGRASNANDGSWSFRHAIEEMTPDGTNPGDFTADFLRGLRVTSVNAIAQDDRSGVETLLAARSTPAMAATPRSSLTSAALTISRRKAARSLATARVASRASSRTSTCVRA